MTGDVKFLNGRTYVTVNEHGTLERLPALPWTRRFQIAIATAIKPWPIYRTREFCWTHGINIEGLR
jgi:hypothetical protein